MLCPKCDTKMEDQDNYCSKCGYKREPPKPDPEPSNKPGDEQIVSLMLAFLLLFFILVIVLSGTLPTPL